MTTKLDGAFPRPRWYRSGLMTSAIPSRLFYGLSEPLLHLRPDHMRLPV